MPIYEFECTTCGTPFEKLVRSAAAVTEVTCPTCGSHHITKKLSLFAAPMGGSRSTFGTAAADCAPSGT